MNTVIVAYGDVETALEWAKENCPSYITNEGKITYLEPYPRCLSMLTMLVTYSFLFSNEDDAIVFRLKFGL